MSDREGIKTKCPKCKHKEVLDGLNGWSAIILKTCVCEKCNHKGSLDDFTKDSRS